MILILLKVVAIITLFYLLVMLFARIGTFLLTGFSWKSFFHKLDHDNTPLFAKDHWLGKKLW